MASRNIENCKEASRNKGQFSLELPDHEVAPDILDPLQLVQGYAFHRCCRDAGKGVSQSVDCTECRNLPFRIYIADHACRSAAHNRVGLDIACNDGSGTNHRIMPDHQSGKDRRTRPDRRIPANRRDLQARLMLFASREIVIRECCIGSNKDIVFDDHPVPQLDPGFHRDAVTDYCLIFNKHMVTDVAVLPDHGAVQNMGKRPDLRSGPHFGSLAEALRVDKIVHIDLPKRSSVRTMDWGRPLVFSKVRHRYAPRIPMLKVFNPPKKITSNTIE